MTILHSIPPYRQHLLSLGDTLDDYGSSPTWWSGDVDTGLGLVTSSDGDGLGLNLTHETQRLMAFLDASNRLYGSVMHLARALCEIDGNVEHGTTAFCTHLEDIAYSTTSQTHRSMERAFRSTFKNGQQVSEDTRANHY